MTEKKSKIGNTLLRDGFNDDADSTDVSKAGDFTAEKQKRTTAKSSPVYDWSEVAYLFEDGIIPDELL